MTPEHLVACAQLSQWYKFGMTEGSYKHLATANVKVSEIASSSTAVLSTPSLLDLLNDENVAPQTVDREALEKSLFDNPDPYDLNETDRVDASISGDSPSLILRSSTRWDVAEYVKLDSTALAQLILPTPDSDKGGKSVPVTVPATTEMEMEDWDVED